MAKDIKFRISLNIDGKEQLVTATTNVKEMRKRWDEAERSTQRFSRSLMNLENTFSMLERGFSSMKELSDGLMEYNRMSRTASQMTGLTGDALNALRSDAQGVADVYGVELTEVLTGASRLMKGFGVDGAEAMRLIRDGLMSGADSGGQMFDILQEYPAYFKEAGMSAEQFMAVITNGANMGVFNDKAADTIKEGNLRLREMTTATQDALNGIGLDAEKIQRELSSGMTTTFEVMQQVGAKLKELPQTSAAVGTAIADIFGGPGEDAGIAYIESLADMDLSMKNLRAQAGETAEGFDAQVDSLSALNSMVLDVVDAFNAIPGLQPFLNITSQVGMTIAGLGSLVGALNAMGAASAAAAIKTTVFPAVVQRIKVVCAGARAALAVVTGALEGEAVGATTAAFATRSFQAALRGAMISTGVGAAIVVVTMALEALIDAMGDTADGFEEVDAAAEAAKQKQEQYQQQINSVNADMMQSIATLKNFNGTKEDEKKLVEQMNNKYGDALGYYDSVSNWYDAAMRRMQELASEQANYVKTTGWHAVKPTDSGERGNGKGERASGAGTAKSVAQEKTRLEELDALIKKAQTDFTKANGTKQAEIQANIDKWKEEKEQIELQMKAAERPVVLDSLNDVDAELQYQQTLYGMVGQSARSGVSKAIASLKELREVMEDMGHVYVDPSSITDFDTLDKELDYWQRQLKRATTLQGKMTAASNIAALNTQGDAIARNGGDAEKREFRNRAETQVRQIQTDMSIGLKSEGAGQSLIDQINERLQNVGLKPIDVEVDVTADTSGVEAVTEDVEGIFSSLGNVDLSSFESVRTALQNFVGIGDKASGAAKGFAAAGASAAAMGNAMQQLGADSAAAKAGLIAASLGQLALSFATAMASAGKDSWISWLAFGMSGLATLMSIMQTVGAFATGGIVGGNSKSGDKLLARVNSGEMILNQEQQARLWKMVNGSYQNIGVGYSQPNLLEGLRSMGDLVGSAEQVVTVHVKSDSRYLVTEIENIKRVMRKSGRIL